jgi:hypothetical protein
MIKIRFNSPYLTRPSINGIEIAYPYTFIYKYDNEFGKVISEERVYMIGISTSLLMQWNMHSFMVLNRNLIFLLFPFVIRFVKEKAQDKTLKNYDEQILTTEFGISEYPFDSDSIPIPNGYEIQIEENLESLTDKINRGQLAADLIQKRDNINALFYSKYREKLLLIDQERNLLDFFKQVNSEEEFTFRLASFASLISNFNVKILRSITSNYDENIKSIALFDKYLNNLQRNNIAELLRNINRLRQGYPIHSDKVDGFIEAHHKLGLTYPITNFESTWLSLLQKYLAALDQVILILKKDL